MFEKAIRQFIHAHALLAPEERLVVGVSGGVDSVVLLYWLHQSGYQPVAVHVNHQLRAEASEGDEAFVRSLCVAWEMPLIVERVDVQAEATAQRMSIEAAARAVRYRCLQQAAEAQQVRAVATGHHLDDQAETVLLNLFRGAGPEGLAGMPASRPLSPGSSIRLVRPLLGVRRAALEAYARAEGLAWREDASNADLQHRRNALRHVILPAIAQHFGDAATDSIARSAALVRAYLAADFTPALEQYISHALREEPPGGRLDLAYARALPEVWRGRLVMEALRRWVPGAPVSTAFVQEVAALCGAQVGHYIEVPGGRIWRERGSLFFLPEAEDAESGSMVLHPGVSISVPGGTLRVEVLDERPDRLDAGTPDVVFVDADALSFPLVVRPWAAGDRFQPFGMEGSKKVSDYLTDVQCPPHQRAGVQVVCSEGKIVWVVGFRLAEAVRVQPTTTRFAKFTFIRSG